MSDERKAILAQHKEHRLEVEKNLFQVIQNFSAKEDMTAADVSALAALTGAFIAVQQMAY